MNAWLFPRWFNKIFLLGAALVFVGAIYVVLMVWYGASPKTLDVGYAPVQPVEYSHALHVDKLKMDCRYCHTTVEKAAFAAIPPTKTCANCHSGVDKNGMALTAAVHPKSNKLLPVRESMATGLSIPWVKVHDLPDYVYFNHSAHVTRGVGCVSCHGRVDKMERVSQVKPLSMSWCLDCHRNPNPHLRPLDQITNLNWDAERDEKASAETVGERVRAEFKINPPTNCSTCHR